MNTRSEQFYMLAERYGHSVAKLRLGKEVRSVITVNSLDELKALLHDGGLPPETRSARGAKILNTFAFALDEEKSGVDGLLRRVEAHLVGDVPLSDNDKTHLKSAFPLRLNAVSGDTKTLGKNEVWNLDTLDPNGTGHVLVNLGTLIMEPGSSIVIHNKTLNFTVDTIVRNRDDQSPGPGYDIAILGLTGDTGGQGATGTPNPASTGGTGKVGNCQSAGISGDAGQTGATGSIGNTGATGGTGYDGKPSLSAQVTINLGLTGSTSGNNAGKFLVYTKSGAGGAGGTGGAGGNGGQGGTGGNGATCMCEGSGAGSGGRGGTAGRGGTGGAGGNGVDGSHIFFTVPPGQGNKIIQLPLDDAPPGKGGAGGGTGNPGGGGAGGVGGKHNGNGSSGGTGPGNSKGNDGPTGARSGKSLPIKIDEK